MHLEKLGPAHRRHGGEARVSFGKNDNPQHSPSAAYRQVRQGLRFRAITDHRGRFVCLELVHG